MVKLRFKNLILALFGASLMGCQADIAIEDLTDKVNDFGNSFVSVGAPAAANGVATVTVTVNLVNSDGSKVSGFTPTFDVSAFPGVSSSGCSASDGNGISTCNFTSTIQGIKTANFNNFGGIVAANLSFFLNVTTGDVVGFAPGGNHNVTTSGHVVNASVGFMGGPLMQEMSGHKVYKDFQGQVESN